MQNGNHHSYNEDLMLYLQMVSAERVMDYCTLEPEASLETHPDSDKPPPNWPERGHIELADVTYRHSAKGPLVLKGISVNILPCEKVSIYSCRIHTCLLLSFNYLVCGYGAQ